MMTIDTNTLEQRALHEDGCYMVGINSINVESVLMNGDPLAHCIFVDINIGVAIVNKTHIGGNVVVFEGGIVTEVVFGKFEVKLKD